MGDNLEGSEGLGNCTEIDGDTVVDNKVRYFSMYDILKRPLTDFLTEGDGIHALPVYEEEYYPESDMIDGTLINIVKFIATAFGRSRLPQAFKIVERIQREDSTKCPLRFRSQHPLFVDGSTRYQNVCLVSGMVHLGIPILPYFDGEKVLDLEGDSDKYLELLRAENSNLF